MYFFYPIGPLCGFTKFRLTHSPWMQHHGFTFLRIQEIVFSPVCNSPFSFSLKEFWCKICSANPTPLKKKMGNSQNSLWVNPLVCQEDPHSNQNRGAAIMPQCFQWNVTAIVDQGEAGVGGWDEGHGDSPPPTSPVVREARYCLVGLWPGGGGVPRPR